MYIGKFEFEIKKKDYIYVLVKIVMMWIYMFIYILLKSSYGKYISIWEWSILEKSGIFYLFFILNCVFWLCDMIFFIDGRVFFDFF